MLNVPRNADLAEIKVAYKKLALRWHPDKNLDNQVQAKEQFQVLQQAYDVLSDRQERARYDGQHQQIPKFSKPKYEGSCLDVNQYCTMSCFKGYGDDEEGFYAVYRRVFEKIAKEDLPFMGNKMEFCSVPMFGNSESDYEQIVTPFYNFWMCYSTKKSYVWLDSYNIYEISDKNVKRWAKNENKKVREQARKKRNEEVGDLVAYVKHRDKRIQAHLKLMEAKVLEHKRKMKQIKLQKKLERKARLEKEAAQHQ